MNISLRQVKMDASQTMFITSTGTVLFTSHSKRDPRGYQSTTVITSIDDHGSIVEVGHIKWNEHVESVPSVCVKTGLVALRTIGNGDSFATIFRGSDRRIYRWRKEDDVVVLSENRAPLAPIAIAYDDLQSISTVDEAGNVILCVQLTGFHLFHEIIATFILFERLSQDDGRKMWVAPASRRGACILSREPNDSCWPGAQHVPPAWLSRRTGHYVPSLRTSNTHVTVMRSIADLTGELLRRHKYPSAYGGFGDIWKCDWLKDGRVIQVAVKVMRTNLTGVQNETQKRRIGRELKVWMRLEHHSVLPLYGISFDFGTFPAMVCPWVEGGTLSKYLERHEGLELSTRLQLLSDVADGLQYLHGCGIVHGDLTGSNVLIKDNGKACLSDFGLSRIFMEATGSCFRSSTIRGSVRWAAPELFEVDEDVDEGEEHVHVVPSPQSDIYSFGSTMLQVLTGKVPYHYYKYDAQVLVALSRGLRPARPDDLPIDDTNWMFMQRCWSRQSRRVGKNVRPCIEEVVEFLSVAKSRCGHGLSESL